MYDVGIWSISSIGKELSTFLLLKNSVAWCYSMSGSTVISQPLWHGENSCGRWCQGGRKTRARMFVSIKREVFWKSRLGFSVGFGVNLNKFYKLSTEPSHTCAHFSLRAHTGPSFFLNFTDSDLCTQTFVDALGRFLSTRVNAGC